MASLEPEIRLFRFADFEVDLATGELRKSGAKVKFGGQPFQILSILLERRGVLVTREELQKRLCPNTFVDVDHNLNTAINKIGRCWVTQPSIHVLLRPCRGGNIGLSVNWRHRFSPKFRYSWSDRTMALTPGAGSRSSRAFSPSWSFLQA